MAKRARADMLLRRAIFAPAFENLLPLFVLSLRFSLVDPFLFGHQLLRRIPAPVTSPSSPFLFLLAPSAVYPFTSPHPSSLKGPGPLRLGGAQVRCSSGLG